MKSDLMSVLQAAYMPRFEDEFDNSSFDFVAILIRLKTKEMGNTMAGWRREVNQLGGFRDGGRKVH